MNSKCALFILLSILAFGCWERKIDGDKHSNLPLFPNHTNNQFKIIKLPYKSASKVFKIENSFVILCKIDTVGDISSLIVLDSDFKEIRRIKIDNKVDFIRSCAFDEESKTIYIIDDALRTNIIYRYSFPDFKESIVRRINEDSIADILRQRGEKKSRNLLGISNYDSVTYAFIAHHYFNDVDYVLNYGCVSILKKTNLGGPEYFIEYCNGTDLLNSDYLNAVMEKHSIMELRTKGIEFIGGKNFIEFDEAVMGNTGTSNHYIGAVTSFGYKYYHVILSKDSTTFKYYTDNLDMALVHILNSGSDVKEIIVYDEEHGDYYSVSQANLK